MMGSPGDGGDTFTTLVSLLADPRAYQDKLKALEKSKKDANVAWGQANDAVKKSEFAKAAADTASKGLATRYAEIDKRTSLLEEKAGLLNSQALQQSALESKLRSDRKEFEASRKAAEDAASKKARELLDREAAVKKREAEADAEIALKRAAFDKEKAAHLVAVEADRQAAAAARKEAELSKAAAEKLRNEHQSRLDKLVALASGR